MLVDKQKRSIRIITDAIRKYIISKNLKNIKKTKGDDINKFIEDKEYKVLTEEVPNISEIITMLNLIGHNISGEYKIKPCITGGNIFKGEWILEIPGITVNIYLFKGRSSSVDYMLFNGNYNLDKGEAGDALVILESTKTCDDSSRNTAVYQRITKFVMYDRMYPESKAIKVMFYCDNKWKNKLTATAKFGMRLKTTLDIHIYTLNDDKDIVKMQEKFEIKSYESSDELIESKNAIKQKKGNVSIRMSRSENNIYISLKLDKGNAPGIISHDPNVGFLSGVIGCFEKLNPGKQNKYIIENHGINQKYFDKCPKSKLWYCCNGINNIEFDGCEIIKRPKLPDKYFTIENKMTEKISTILCEMISKQKTIFSNHGCCALTCIQGLNCEENVGRTMHRPDLVLKNIEKKEILIIEGKVEKDLGKGIVQLSDEYLDGFINIIKQNYTDYSIKKGLCITISDIENINKYKNLQYPIIFAIDKDGRFSN
tara:strand:- start:773 stop:2221 length:1449 start_codon:yes stop_codon:yes gene_type:complete